MRHFKTLLLLLLLCGIAYLSCKKDDPPAPQLVKGKVLDKKTGKPVPNATVSLLYYDPEASTYQQNRWKFIQTDYKGSFEYIDQNGWVFSNLSDVEAEGYLRCSNVGCSVSFYGPSDSIVAMITPLDGVLRIKITNKYFLHEKIFVWLSYPSLIEASGGAIDVDPISHSHPEIILDKDSSYTEIISLPTSEFIAINWLFQGMPTPASPIMSDTISINIQDTMTYLIEY